MNGEPSDCFVTQYVHKTCGAEPTYDICLKMLNNVRNPLPNQEKSISLRYHFDIILNY